MKKKNITKTIMKIRAFIPCPEGMTLDETEKLYLSIDPNNKVIEKDVENNRLLVISGEDVVGEYRGF